jgi:hypothetical protein
MSYECTIATRLSFQVTGTQPRKKCLLAKQVELHAQPEYRFEVKRRWLVNLKTQFYDISLLGAIINTLKNITGTSLHDAKKNWSRSSNIMHEATRLSPIKKEGLKISGLIYLARHSVCETAHCNAAACAEQYKRKYADVSILNAWKCFRYTVSIYKRLKINC